MSSVQSTFISKTNVNFICYSISAFVNIKMFCIPYFFRQKASSKDDVGKSAVFILWRVCTNTLSCSWLEESVMPSQPPEGAQAQRVQAGLWETFSAA